MSGAETARRRVVQRRIGGAEMALPRAWGIFVIPCLKGFALLKVF